MAELEQPEITGLEQSNNQDVADKTQEDSKREELSDYIARATALYAVKKYEEAAELYSQATELQAELNGEMSEDNADLLYAYGRCLFHLAQKTSTVLGGTAASAQLKASDKKPSKKRKIKPEPQEGETNATSLPIDVVPADDLQPKPATDKPFFQIEGDAPDWDESDGEEDGEAEGEDEDEEEEEEDDFNTAYEILDLARVLFLRRLDSQTTEADRSSDHAHNTQPIKTRLADVYDLQAEINLEGEKFTAAATDMQSCLEIKQQLYTFDNALLAECHYKLSLALEAACQVQQRDKDGNPVGDITIDWTLRNQAVDQQAKAIESCKLRITNEQQVMNALQDTQSREKQKAKEEIDDVEDMVQAMEQRLDELKKPPVSVKAETEKDAKQELMGSVLGQMLGAGSADKDEQKVKLAEVMASANDLSGMVKRKKPVSNTTNGSGAVKTEVQGSTTTNGAGNGKRKIDQVEFEETSIVEAEPVKKVRIEDVID